LGPLGSGLVQNFSPGGLALLVPGAVDIGAVLTVKLEAPEAERLGPLEARVIHGRPTSDGRWVIGAALTRAPGPEYARLLATLQAANGTAAVTPGQRREPERSRVRATIRLTCNLVGLCHWDEGDYRGSCSVRVRNISSGGLSLFFESEPAPVQFVTVDLVNSSRTVTCSARARLLYKVEQAAGGFIVGASFPERLDSEKLRALLA
jgi:hypothetical protein